MIVCSCNVLKDSQIREAAKDGARCEREAYAKLGCRPQCEQCLPFAHEIVEAENPVSAVA